MTVVAIYHLLLASLQKGKWVIVFNRTNKLENPSFSRPNECHNLHRHWTPSLINRLIIINGKNELELDNSYELRLATLLGSARAGEAAMACWLSVGAEAAFPSATSVTESKVTPTHSRMDLNCCSVLRRVMQKPLEAGMSGNSGKSTFTAVGNKVQMCSPIDMHHSILNNVWKKY